MQQCFYWSCHSGLLPSQLRLRRKIWLTNSRSSQQWSDRDKGINLLYYTTSVIMLSMVLKWQLMEKKTNKKTPYILGALAFFAHTLPCPWWFAGCISCFPDVWSGFIHADIAFVPYRRNIWIYGAHTRRHGEVADSHTSTRIHKHAHMHRHAWFPQLGRILLLKFPSTLIDWTKMTSSLGAGVSDDLSASPSILTGIRIGPYAH